MMPHFLAEPVSTSAENALEQVPRIMKTTRTKPEERRLNDVATEPSVTVTVPARLHLGFLDLNGGMGRRFGGIGLAISDLKTRIAVRRAAQMRVSGAEHVRVGRYADRMRRALSLEAQHHVEVTETVPAHAGLGSGTQLALAVAAGIRTLHGLPIDAPSDAIMLERGARSGLGIGLFTRGGLVVDGGRGATGASAEGASAARPAPIISRLAFPEAWRVLVVLDPARQGTHGDEELAAFATLGVFPESDAAHLCRLVVMKALPALADQDLASFGAAIGELQARLGDYFAVAQGARFTSAAVAAALAAMAGAGAVGIGQSSWGPTGFAFAASQADAERIADVGRTQDSGLDIRICRGLNRGAEISAPAHVSE
jgi:beta-ribofuranosylaminobenzene 5'-phosphate synthase